jgi:nickel transport protein
MNKTRIQERSGIIPAVIALCAAFFLSATPAFAHRVKVFAYVEGDMVHVRGYFSRKSPAKNCKITVFTAAGTELLTGRTDDKGRFTFKATVKADLKIKLDAGEGHSAYYTLKADELPDGLSEQTAPPEKNDKKKQRAENEPASGTAGNEKESTFPQDMETLERIVEKAVGRKLAPIREMLIEQKQRSEDAVFEKALAGIGIIFGIMGIIMYFHSRSRRKDA